MKSPQAVVRSYDAVRWHRTKLVVFCRTTMHFCRMRSRTTKYDGSSYEFRSSYSYDSLWPFRPSYDCILGWTHVVVPRHETASCRTFCCTTVRHQSTTTTCGQNSPGEIWINPGNPNPVHEDYDS